MSQTTLLHALSCDSSTRQASIDITLTFEEWMVNRALEFLRSRPEPSPRASPRWGFGDGRRSGCEDLLYATETRGLYGDCCEKRPTPKGWPLSL